MQAPLPRVWDAIQVLGYLSLPEPRSFERLLGSEAHTIVFCSELPGRRKRHTAYIVINAGFHVRDNMYLTLRTRRDGSTLLFGIEGGRQLNGSPVLYTVENRLGQGIMWETCPFTLKILCPGGLNYGPAITVTIDIIAHQAIDVCD